MKEYVLDQLPPGELSPPPPFDDGYVPPPARTSWRTIVLLIVLESLALALLYVVMIGFPGPSAASVETAAGYDPTVASAAPAPAPVAPAEARPAPAVVVEPAVDAAPSRISREHGRYVIELHSSAIGPALEMLTKATGATVRGTEVLAGNGARITRTIATDSPLEAWQAVFGGVANFAATCSRGACAVRFVPSANPALAAMRPLPPAPDEGGDQGSAPPSVAAAPPPLAAMAARTPPPAAAAQPGEEPMPDN